MATISIGTPTAPPFIATSILPSLSTTFPMGVIVTGLGSGSFATGSHRLLVAEGSVLHIADAHVAATRPVDVVAAFQTTGTGVWSIFVDGTINAFNTYTAGATTIANGVGIDLGNANSLNASTRIEVRAEGSVFGNFIGLSTGSVMVVENSGLIEGGYAGIVADSARFEGSNLNLPETGTARTVGIDNFLGGEISGGSYGILNSTESTLSIGNLGTIRGGNTSLVVSNFDVDSDQSTYEAAISSGGRLMFTNFAPGIVEGGVFSNWLGSTVNNQGKIYGTITAQIDEDYLQDVDEDETARLNANRDADFTDNTDYLITDARLIGTTITNAGLIVGGEDYLLFRDEESATFGVSDEGFPDLVDANGRAVLFDDEGLPYYQLDTAVEVTVAPAPGTKIYYNLDGDELVGDPSDWTAITNPNTGALLRYEDSEGTVIGVVDGLPEALPYPNGDISQIVQYTNGNVTEPFYVIMTYSAYYPDVPNQPFETPDGDLVYLQLVNGAYFLNLESSTFTPQQVAIDGSILRDVITNAASGVIFGDVFTAGGSDSLTNAGKIYGVVDMGDGNDTLTTSGGSTLAAPLTPNSELVALDMGDGNDQATLGGSIFGDVEFGDGNDTVVVSGIIAGDMDVDEGDDRITIAVTGRLSGSVNLDDGMNRLTNQGIIGSDNGDTALFFAAAVEGGEDDDSVSNFTTGIIYSSVDLSDGNDMLTNSGRIVQIDPEMLAVYMGHDDDWIINSGTIGVPNPIYADDRLTSTNLAAEFMQGGIDLTLVVDMGDGRDLLENSSIVSGGGIKSGIINGVITMGEGNDTLRGGANTEFVLDDEGVDSYRLGAGADAFIITDPDGDVDTLDGGTGLNLIMFTPPPNGGDAPDSPFLLGNRIDLAAGRITYEIESFTDINGGESGKDTILNVQQVFGSMRDDVIIGGIVAETLAGGEGDDTIAGGRGRDMLYGDEGADVFLFASATDSGLTRATRDVISDFSTSDGDQIWLNMDSNTRAGSVANEANEFVFVGNNVAFTRSTYEGEFYAEVRTLTQAGLTLLEVDTNGDGRADFSFALRGLHVLDMDDFAGNNFITLI